MQSLTDKYFSELTKRGYNAIKDVNDNKFSGYKALNPIIAFNAKGKIDVVDVGSTVIFPIAFTGNSWKCSLGITSYYGNDAPGADILVITNRTATSFKVGNVAGWNGIYVMWTAIGY